MKTLKRTGTERKPFGSLLMTSHWTNVTWVTVTLWPKLLANFSPITLCSCLALCWIYHSEECKTLLKSRKITSIGQQKESKFVKQNFVFMNVCCLWVMTSLSFGSFSVNFQNNIHIFTRHWNETERPVAIRIFCICSPKCLFLHLEQFEHFL